MKVAYFTNIAPHYREKLWLKLIKDLDVELHFFFGSSNSIAAINYRSKEIWNPYKRQIHEVKNIRFKQRLVYQSKILRQVIFKNWDCIIILGDANLISNWLLASICKLKKIPVIFWGHGIYGNEVGIKKQIRKKFYKLADLNLVYGYWAKKQMIKEGFDTDKVKVIFNSVNYEESKNLREFAHAKDFYYKIFDNDLPTLIFIGRLTKIKKLHLLVEAVYELNKGHKKYNLIFIGDGEYKNKLQDLAANLNEDVCFYGACYEEEKISKFIANADLCVSPGNVGLTSIHAMSYGTPVCTNDDFKNQMPEFEAIIEGETGCFFDSKENNLAGTIASWFKNAPSREIIRANCYKVVDEHYNPDNQTRIMKEAINSVTSRHA
jgi:glycosyltransferase involved in cell wall biosynthesis